MKSTYAKHSILGRTVEITEVNNEFFVFIDGVALNRPHRKGLGKEQRQARFSTSARAYKAAKMTIARDKQGFIA